MFIFKEQRIKGFSLIEVLVSVLLLAGLISIVVQLSYGNNRRMKKARHLEKAAQLLEFKMLELEEEFKGEETYKLSVEAEGDFENEENYSWSYQTQSLALPSSESLLALFKLPESELNIKMIQILKSVLSATVVELKLTVSYKGKKRREKDFSYSLVSYFINYEDVPSFTFDRISELLPAGANLIQ